MSTVSHRRTLRWGAPSYPDRRLRWRCYQEPGSSLDYSLDLRRFLDDLRDEVATVSVSAAPSGTGELTVGPVNVVDSTVTVLLTGGVPGRVYLVRFDVVTATTDEELEVLVELVMSPFQAVFPPPVPPNAGFGPYQTWPSNVAPPDALLLGGVPLVLGANNFLTLG